MNISSTIYSYFSGNEAIVGLLIRSGADINQKDFKGMTALHEAALNSEWKCWIIQEWINCMSNPCHSHDLHILDHEKIAETLIKNGANINQGDIDGLTAMHVAIAKGNLWTENHFNKETYDNQLRQRKHFFILLT